MLRYKRTHDGEWVVTGPAEEVKVGVATVTTREGHEKSEPIVRVGKAYKKAGVSMRYGYLCKPCRYKCAHCNEIVAPDTVCRATDERH